MGKNIHIFLAGGKSTRFTNNKALYTFADGQTMIEKVMSPYKNEECYILAHEDIARQINLLDIKQCELVVANSDTETSTETAYYGLIHLEKQINSKDHVMFHDCDVLTDKITRATSIIQYGLPSYGKYKNKYYFAGTYYFGTYEQTRDYLVTKLNFNLPDAFCVYDGQQWVTDCAKFFPFNTPIELEISEKLLELYDDPSDTICVDVDGTLINNNNMIIKSWESAGVEDYKPGEHVDCSKNVKAIKQEYYKKYIANTNLTLKEIVLQLLLVTNYKHIVLATGMSVDSLYITAPLFLDKFMNNKNTTIVLLDKSEAMLEIPNCKYFIGDSETDGACAEFMKKVWLKWQW